jgi:ligand-binding SRPBCC domain-containing protein
MARIEICLQINAPQERRFDLARSIEAHTHSTANTRERVVGGKTTGLLSLGDFVTWQARHFGITQKLSSRITVYDRPRHFRDTMVSGAFACFDHDHFFSAANNGTMVRDVFEYRAPLGPLGRLVEQLFLTAYMRKFLEARVRELKTLAESGRWVQFLPPAT